MFRLETWSSLPSCLPSHTSFPGSSRWDFCLSCSVNMQRNRLIGSSSEHTEVRLSLERETWKLKHLFPSAYPCVCVWIKTTLHTCADPGHPPRGERRLTGEREASLPTQSVSFSRWFKARFPFVYTRVILATENLFADGERARVLFCYEPSRKKDADSQRGRAANLWICFQRVDLTGTTACVFFFKSWFHRTAGLRCYFTKAPFCLFVSPLKTFFDFFFSTQMQFGSQKNQTGVKWSIFSVWVTSFFEKKNLSQSLWQP